MLLNVAMVIVLAGFPVDIHAGENELTTLRVDQLPGSANLQWRDAEDVVRGTVTPFPIRAGAPVTVSLVVGTVQGEAFTGPVTISLRPLQDLGGVDAVTVTPGAGAKAWVHTFTLREAGEHRIELSFRTTHLKVIRGVVPVEPARLPRWLLGAVGGTLIVGAVSVGVWLTLRRREGQASS